MPDPPRSLHPTSHQAREMPPCKCRSRLPSSHPPHCPEPLPGHCPPRGLHPRCLPLTLSCPTPSDSFPHGIWHPDLGLTPMGPSTSRAGVTCPLLLPHRCVSASEGSGCKSGLHTSQLDDLGQVQLPCWSPYFSSLTGTCGHRCVWGVLSVAQGLMLSVSTHRITWIPLIQVSLRRPDCTTQTHNTLIWPEAKAHTPWVTGWLLWVGGTQRGEQKQKGLQQSRRNLRMAVRFFNSP